MELVFQVFFTFFGFSLLLLGPFFDMIHIQENQSCLRKAYPDAH